PSCSPASPRRRTRSSRSSTRRTPRRPSSRATRPTETAEPVAHHRDDLVVAPFHVVAGPLDPVERDRAGDGGGLPLELLGRAEGVAGAPDEQAREVEGREVLDAESLGLAGRVERIGEEHEP